MDNRCVDERACNSAADCAEGATCEGGMCVTNVSRSLEMCTYPTVRFDFNEANLRPEARDGLSEVADCIEEAGGTLIIEGHADERGTEEYNLALGDRRARAVMEYLSRLGVPMSKMRAVSKGEAEPLVDASNESAWQKNRRVEFEPVQ
jgi:peptidoglycan-associated lipoprotein